MSASPRHDKSPDGNVHDDIEEGLGGFSIFLDCSVLELFGQEGINMPLSTFRKTCNFYHIQFMFENSATRMEL